MQEKRGKGYIGKRMSVNAHESYMRNERPRSKWRKGNLKNAVAELVEMYDLDIDVELFNKLTTENMRKLVLVSTGWHHTGAHYKVTIFYKIDESYVKNILSNEIIENQLAKHQEYLKATKGEREREKVEREITRNAKEFEAYIKDFVKVSNYKTASGLWRAFNSGRVTEEELITHKKRAIEQRRNELSKTWACDPNAEYQRSRLNDDEFIWEYVK